MAKIYSTDNAGGTRGAPLGLITVPHVKVVKLTNDQILDLKASPVEILPAQGAGKIIELVSMQLFFDRTAAYTEAIANLDVKYGAAGTTIATVEATGFADAATDVATKATMSAAANIAGTAIDNQGLFLAGVGAAEWGAGDPLNEIVVVTTFMVHDSGF